MSVGGRGTSTTRGSSSRRGNIPLPNLSIAGKRETKNEQPLGTRGSRGGGGGKRERGGRGGRGGRGRGRGRESTKHLFIEQQGIFSSGLDDNGRYDRTKCSNISKANLGREKKVNGESGEGITRKNDDEDLKPVTYETEWLSDDEGDKEKLEELLGDGFLSDLKPGKVIPLVLPETEEMQFQQLVVKDEENGCESMDTSLPPPTKKKKKQRLKSECESEEDVKTSLIKEMKTTTTLLDPTAASSRRAAAIMRKVQEDEDGSVVMLQLPSTLSSLQDSTSHQDAVEGSKPKESKGPVTKHCLDGFANGSKIGKLRIRKGGRIELSICGISLDVTCGVSSQHNESVLLINTGNQRETSMIKSERSDEQLPSRGYVLGKIVDSFICSHNLPEALDGKREEQERYKHKFHDDIKDEAGKKDDLEMKDLLLELRSIEKKEESWAKWTLEYPDILRHDDS